MKRRSVRLFFGAALTWVWGITVLAPVASAQVAAGPDVAPAGLARTVDLDLGETRQVELADGSKARVTLLDLQEIRDNVRRAVREARVRVEVNGTSLTLTSATYHLPISAAGVQIDCPITRGHADARSRENVWGLKKDARLRLWPAGSPWIEPGTFTYPARQRWFASDSQMANEPTFVNGDETPGTRSIYYHWGLDFGGAEGLVEVVAATDGLVVSAAGTTLPAHTNSPAKPRYDVIYVQDARGWYYRYSHLAAIDVQPGQRVRRGQRLGLLGKEGGSGGWSHLHFDITRRQPSGDWGIEEAYAYAWEAWRNESQAALIAVARPHRLAALGESVRLDGAKSWSATGDRLRYDWTFSDGTTASGPGVERRYATPGTYSEILQVTDAAGLVARDFVVVQVLDTNQPGRLPPTIHAAYYPTKNLRAGDAVTFKVRTFRTQHGEEVWNFGDGTPLVRVKSDGNANVHAKDGYAITQHRYARAGRYLARVERGNERGEKAIAHLDIEVEEAPSTANAPVAMPRIAGEWWTIAGDPDLGAYTSPKQQPVDFAIWPAADGTWQLWSCIRGTQCGGNTRLFHRWEGRRLTDVQWTARGIAMEAKPDLGETRGGLQAPFVLRDGKQCLMFYGDWEHICVAVSKDGKNFQRRVNADGMTGLFGEGAGANARDPMVLFTQGQWYCYYTAHPSRQGAVYCRTSPDTRKWSDSRVVAFGGAAGTNFTSAECPFVVERPPGEYYLFRTQRYGENGISRIYHSRDPMNFGVNNDAGHLIGSLPVAAPEVFQHDGQWYVASLLPSLKGIRVARLEWGP